MGASATTGLQMVVARACISSTRKMFTTSTTILVFDIKMTNTKFRSSSFIASGQLLLLQRYTSVPLKFKNVVTRAVFGESEKRDPSGLTIDLRGKRAFIAGVADDNDYGWAIAKAILLLLLNGSLMEIAKFYPLDAVYDTPENVP